MTHCIASGTAHAVSHKIKISFLKNCLKSNLQSQIYVSQGHTDIPAGNSGYSLHSSGSGVVQAVASLLNMVRTKNLILYIFCETAVLNTNLLHDIYLFLPDLSASVFGHLHGAGCSFDAYNLYVNVFGNSL
jgi:hypothetical protein